MRRQRHDRDAAELLQGKIEIGKFDAIRQLHDHPVERFKAFIEQIQGDASSALIELSIGDRLFTIDDRHSIGVPLENFFESFAQRTIFPITLGAVSRGKFGGKSNDAVYHSMFSLRSRIDDGGWKIAIFDSPPAILGPVSRIFVWSYTSHRR